VVGVERQPGDLDRDGFGALVAVLVGLLVLVV